MDRDELLKEIQSYLDKFDDLNINTFQRGMEEMNILNPYFGFKQVTEYQYHNGYGVNSIWMSAGAGRLQASSRMYGYGGDERNYTTANMTDRNLEGVREMVKSLYEKRMKDIERTQANPKLEELLPEIGEWAKRCIAIAGKDFSVAVGHGRRQSDGPQPYHALVVCDKGYQIASIPLRQDAYGKLMCRVNHPLYGSSGEYDEFTSENWKDKIHEALEGAVGLRINMEREDSPVRNPEINVNYWGVYTITCEIDGQKQLRKQLKDGDRSDYICGKDISRGFYMLERRYDLAAKYFKNEISLAMDSIQSRGMGR